MDLSMADDILEGVTGRSDKPPVYIPRMSKERNSGWDI